MIDKKRIKKFLYALGGMVSLILAILGIFVPGLPCTPFALLSAALFSKGSARLHNWLLNTKWLGTRIRNYQQQQGISKHGKVKVIILMWAMVLISVFFFLTSFNLKLTVLSAGLLGSFVVWFFVPEAKQAVKKKIQSRQ